MQDKDNRVRLANAVRSLAMDAVERAKSGHPGMPLGMADVVTVLFSSHLNFSVKNPKWYNRDRFVLSAGHGSMLLYSLYYLLGYEDVTIEDIKNFRQLHAKTAGHPEYGMIAAIETTTGPLGQGFANAVGMAFAEKLLANRLPDLVDHHTYVVVGDGCLMEGISQEAASFAAHNNLNKLIVLFDDNNISIDGEISLSSSENQLERFKALGFNVFAVSGHNYAEIEEAISAAKKSDKPAFIACKTKIGFGCPTKEGKSSSHGSPLGPDEIKIAKENLKIDYPAFAIPTEIKQEWEEIAEAKEQKYEAWQHNFSKSSHKEELEKYYNFALSEIADEIAKQKENILKEQKNIATRQASGEALEFFTKHINSLIGGSADLTGSNNTKTSLTQPINKDDFSGRYVYYGIREHAMAAMMNGMALHGGIIPYSGTFLVFSDYCRPAIRLSALMQQKVIYVMTHDSIGLGEDGPTHQPVEHIASLRAMPNLLVMRPCDSFETFLCYEYLLSEENNLPAVICLSRQKTEFVSSKNAEVAKGGYILAQEEGDLDLVIIATGTEIPLALAAKKSLSTKNINARVVSMPSVELFKMQSQDYKKSVLGQKNIFKIVIEAASPFGWRDIVGDNAEILAIDSFGESAPAADLYQHFALTSANIEEIALNNINK